MPNENETNVAQETVTTVSTEQQTQVVLPEKKENEVDEVKLPTNKEELDLILKSAVNKEKTIFLKELGVKSVKEYKDQVSKSQEALTKYDELIKEKESLSKENEALKQTSILDRLGVKDEYREDLIKLAKDRVDQTNPFDAVVKNLIETKYQHTVQRQPVKIGTEKTDSQSIGNGLSQAVVNKYPWLKS